VEVNSAGSVRGSSTATLVHLPLAVLQDEARRSGGARDQANNLIQTFGSDGNDERRGRPVVFLLKWRRKWVKKGKLWGSVKMLNS
jgi:hypothetical protein